jgi:hypothetical protein
VPEESSLDMGFGGAGPALEWARVLFAPGSYEDHYYGRYPDSTYLWNMTYAVPTPIDPGSLGTDPWVIATSQPTPEPGPLTLLASGFLAFGGFGLVRRRRRGKATESTPAN